MQPDLRDPESARAFVSRHLSHEPKRLVHILVIAEEVRKTAEKLTREVHPLDTDLAECAALLHDIGYSPELVRTGFHPVDGERFLKTSGYPDLAALIVGHSCSPEEAELRGFPTIHPSPALEAKLVSYWDMRVKQGGEIVRYSERLADIRIRYGEESLMWEANLRARPRLEKVFAEIDALLGSLSTHS